MTRRSRAREIALQVLYQDDLNPRNNPSIGDALIQRRLHKPELVDFARLLVAGVRRYREELDATIEKTAAHWSLSRMAVTDRNVLRLGAFEILHSTTPDRVAVNEAVELAKRYGTASRPSSSTESSIGSCTSPRRVLPADRLRETTRPTRKTIEEQRQQPRNKPNRSRFGGARYARPTPRRYKPPDPFVTLLPWAYLTKSIRD